MTYHASIDRIRNAKGAERKAIVKLVDWFMASLAASTTDTMKARVAEALAAGVADIRGVRAADTVGVSRVGEV